MNRRILQICPHDTPPFDDVCARYVEAGAACGAQVTTVYLSAAAGQPLAFADYLNAQDLKNTAALRRALQPYAEQRWDLVVCHRYRAYWSVARTGLARNTCIVLAHEFGLMARWQRRLNRRLFATQFKFAGVSQAVADELSAAVGHTLVLPNVVNVDLGRSALLTRTQARVQLGLTDDAFVVGVVGRLHYKKRPQLATSAYGLFHRAIPHARLVFLGDGERDGLATEEGIVVAGFVPHAAHYMKAFDVLLHTAEAEPFGMVVLEAMLAGVPVVTLPHAGPHYALGDLGIYAHQDTAEGFAAALQQAELVNPADYEAQALARIQQHFCVPVLAQMLDQLIDEAAG